MAAWHEPHGSNVSEGLLVTLVLVGLVLAAGTFGAFVVYRILTAFPSVLG